MQATYVTTFSLCYPKNQKVKKLKSRRRTHDNCFQNICLTRFMQNFWSRKWQPIPVFLPGKFHGPRSLAGQSPWGCKESETTEQLRTHARMQNFVMSVSSLKFINEISHSFILCSSTQAWCVFYAQSVSQFEIAALLRSHKWLVASVVA